MWLSCYLNTVQNVSRQNFSGITLYVHCTVFVILVRFFFAKVDSCYLPSSITYLDNNYLHFNICTSFLRFLWWHEYFLPTILIPLWSIYLPMILVDIIFLCITYFHSLIYYLPLMFISPQMFLIRPHILIKNIRNIEWSYTSPLWFSI